METFSSAYSPGSTPLFSPREEEVEQALYHYGTILNLQLPLIEYLSELGPAGVKGLFPFTELMFSSSLEGPVFDAVVDLIANLIELSPSLADWKEYVDFEDETLQSKLEEILASVFSPEIKPTSSFLAERRQHHLLLQVESELKKMTSSERNTEEEALLMQGRGTLPSSSSYYEMMEAASHSRRRRREPLPEKQLLSKRIEEVLSQILSDSPRLREETFATAESLALNTIQVARKSLQRALFREKVDSMEVDGCMQDFSKAVESLADLHRFQHQKMHRTMMSRIELITKLLEERKAEGEEGSRTLFTEVDILEGYLSQVGEQQREIARLREIYERVVSCSLDMDVSSYLCFLYREIAGLYEVSVTLAVGGLISVGKSTVVNCLTGSLLSPDRVETMTSIPTRYVHDPLLSEPVMRVPFAHQLNQVSAKIKKWAEKGVRETTRSLLPKVHLQVLFDKVCNGLTFQSWYKGSEEIRQVSTLIHDLFRLAVDDTLSDAVLSGLPLAWSKGLDFFLTIYTPFPYVRELTGLVNLSVVDTPGINEHGVKKLNHLQVIEDTLGNCNFAALVTNSTSLVSDDLQPLKSLLSSNHQRYKIPVMVLLTHTDQLTNDEKKRMLSLIPNLLSQKGGEEGSSFTPDTVNAVSGIRMVAGHQMLSFLDQHERKPALDDPDPSAKGLAHLFSLLCNGDDLEEKQESYLQLSLEAIRERSKRLIDSSGMIEATKNLVKTALIGGIPRLLTTTRKKVQERLEEFTSELELSQDLREVDLDRIWGKISELCQSTNQEINQLIEQAHHELKAYQQVIKEAMEMFENGTLPEARRTHIKHFEPLLKARVQAFSADGKNLMFGNKEINLKKKLTSIYELLKEGNEVLKKVVEDFLIQLMQSSISRIQQLCRQRKMQLVREIVSLKRKHMALGSQQEELFSLDLEQIFPKIQLFSSVNPTVQQMVVTLGRADFMLSLNQLVLLREVSPKYCRKLMVADLLPRLDTISNVLQSRLELIRSRLSQFFVDRVARTIKSVNESVKLAFFARNIHAFFPHRPPPPPLPIQYFREYLNE